MFSSLRKELEHGVPLQEVSTATLDMNHLSLIQQYSSTKQEKTDYNSFRTTTLQVII